MDRLELQILVRIEKAAFDPRLKRDEFRMNHRRALALCLGMIFSENRFTLFRIMPWPHLAILYDGTGFRAALWFERGCVRFGWLEAGLVRP
jgi:hypothetical protein